MSSALCVTVVGAGAIGLTCALRLSQAGHDVTVVARDLPPNTTSVLAAAIWYPYLALPRDRVTGWAAASYAVFAAIAASSPAAGVRMLPGREIVRASAADPWWRGAVPDFRRLEAGELPSGCEAGWGFTAPTIDMPRYLEWLLGELRARDVELVQRAVTDLDAESQASDAVVVCPGLSARDLLGDHEMTPVRGQIAVLSNPGLREWLLDDSALDVESTTYVIPRLATVVCGGTAQRDRVDLTPDPATGAAILARARQLVPMLAGAEVIAHRVGLRPARSAVRLELAPDNSKIIYCYGHGGAGITLSWGCADEVVALCEA